VTAEFLSFIRRNIGLKQRELAERAGISLSYVQKLEVGSKPINREIERKLIAALGLDEERLIRLKQLFSEVRANSRVS
jgi:transcriptional regulator with XRE-family HTH domain